MGFLEKAQERLAKEIRYQNIAGMIGQFWRTRETAGGNRRPGRQEETTEEECSKR